MDKWIERATASIAQELEACGLELALERAYDLERLLLLGRGGHDPRHASHASLATQRVAETIMAAASDEHTFDLNSFAAKLSRDWVPASDPLGVMRIGTTNVRVRIARDLHIAQRYRAVVIAATIAMRAGTESWLAALQDIDDPARRQQVARALVETVDRLRVEVIALVRDLHLVGTIVRIDMRKLQLKLAEVSLLVDPYAGGASATLRRLTAKRVLIEVADRCVEGYATPSPSEKAEGIAQLEAVEAAFDPRVTGDELGFSVVAMPARMDRLFLRDARGASLTAGLEALEFLVERGLDRDAEGLRQIIRRRFPGASASGYTSP